MNDTKLSAERIAQLSPKRLTLLALELQDQLAAERRRQREPVAIVGVGCRFPGGANSPEAFWDLIAVGQDAISEVPSDRWNIDELYDPDPDAPGKMSTRFGGFVDAIDMFDAELFGIAPREAETMDPQQRILLEVTWEALERAGIAPNRLRGTRTGVFVGICNGDYAHLGLRRGRAAIDAYFASGAAFSVVAGRVAYSLGLEGAAMVIDTACSSSLVAMHEACQHLRAGSISLAIASGVNLICAPETTIALSKAHMMAPDGRCKTFDDSADGFVRAEGCGVLVLKRLEDAIASGDRIWAIIQGSAVNQDGRSSGLTVPNGAAQVDVIRAALANAGLEPDAIDYVEAHGTGTALGDPIEVRALAEALCRTRDAARPLYVGSVKTNIGHLESAAGVAGVIKAVLALGKGQIPPHIHLRKPNHDVAWGELPIRIPTVLTAWPDADKPRLAGVSSFGFSGTNAHIVLAAAPPVALERGPPRESRPCHLLPLSAKTRPALASLRKCYAAFTETSEAPAGDLCHTAAVARAHLRERVAIVADSMATMGAALRSGSGIESTPAASRVAADVEPVFLFTGSGSQWPGMGQALYRNAPVFRLAIDECSGILATRLDVPLEAILNHDDRDGQGLLHRTRYAHPALFAFEYALARLWQSWGIEPAAVGGHSLGEYVAACVAGVFDLADALALVVERARLIDALPGGGAMAAIFASAAEVEKALRRYKSGVGIAAINGPANTVVSGRAELVAEIVAEFGARGTKSQSLLVSSAFHSSLLDPMLDELESYASRMSMRPPTIPLLSNLTGEFMPMTSAPTAAYWRRHAREPVQFAAGVRNLAAHGYRWFIEIGPHPTLLSLLQQSVDTDDLLLVPSIRRGVDEWRQLLEGLATVYVNGADVDWEAFDEPYDHRRLLAPTYQFDRRRFWMESTPADEAHASDVVAHRIVDQPLLTERLDVPGATFRAAFDGDVRSFTYAHRLAGAAMVSAPLFAELLLEAAASVRGAPQRELIDLTLDAPLVLRDGVETSVYVVAVETPDGATAVQIATDTGAGRGERRWRMHARGICAFARTNETARLVPVTKAVLGQRYERRDPKEFYEGLAALGVELGPLVAGIRDLWYGPDGDVVARIELPMTPAEASRFALHPAVADAALQAFGAAVARGEQREALMLAQIRRLSVIAPVGASVWCRAAPVPRDGLAGDVVLYQDDGTVVAELRGVALARAARADSDRPNVDGLGYAVAWHCADIRPARENFGAAGQLAPMSAIEGIACQAFESAAAESGLAVYDDALPAIDAFARAEIAKAFSDLGLDDTRLHDPEAALHSGLIVARHRRLFRRLLEILEQGGTLLRAGSSYRWGSPSTPSASAEGLVDRYPECRAEIELLARCGRDLARVLRGDVDPVALLFAQGAGETLRRLYRETPFARTTNRTIVAALEEALRSVPRSRPVRILEIGAGTGGTTASVLPQLAERRASYCFTDVSPAFLESAAEEFRDRSFVEYESFDVERDPRGQSLPLESFDVIIAANVIHATRDVRETLRHVQDLLAPGGMLLLLEGTTREPWVDLTFGLTDGWWRFADTQLRPDYPLLTSAAWIEVLQDIGFGDVRIVPDSADGQRSRSQALIVSRKTPDAALGSRARAFSNGRRLLVVGTDTPVGSELLRIVPGAVGLSSAGADDAICSEVLHELAQAPDAGVDVLYLGALAASDATTAAIQAVRFGQAVHAAQIVEARLWFISAGAVPLTGDDSLRIEQSPLWGLGRGYALEQPESWGGLVDFDPAAAPLESAWSIVEQITAGSDEDQVAFRGGHRHVPRLQPAELPASGTFSLHADASYLITGGLGGLGLAVARWLAGHGAKHLVLTGRDAACASERLEPELAAIRALGAKVEAVGVDVTDRELMLHVFEDLDQRGTPIRGVFHAAAAIGAAPLASMTAGQVQQMFAAKVAGTIVLHELTRERPLDIFVMFSSTTALLGVAGLAHYAGANQFMDAFAHHRRGLGLPALSVNWGTWDIMRAATEVDRAAFLRGGLRPLAAATALEAMRRLLASGAVQHAVADVDWSTLKTLYESRRRRPFLAHLGATTPSNKPRKPEDVVSATVGEQLRALPAAARHDALIEQVRAAVGGVLKVEAQRLVDLREGFFDMGMDSLMAVELKTRLERLLGTKLPSTLTFNYPNIGAVAGYLEAALWPSAASTPENIASADAKPLKTAVDALDSEDAIEERLAAKLRALGHE